MPSRDVPRSAGPASAWATHAPVLAMLSRRIAARRGHDAVMVLTRGDGIARAAGLRSLRINVFPLMAGLPFGIMSALTPPPPMPAHLTLEFLPALDWTAYGPAAAEDTHIVSACYKDITGRLQAALDRLSAEHPHPVLLGSSRLARRAAAGTIQRARNCAVRVLGISAAGLGESR